ALDVGGKVVAGNWRVGGTVKNVKEGLIRFQTKDGKLAHLLYRLPEKQVIKLKPGDDIQIARVIREGLGVRFHVTIFSGNSLVAAGGYDDGMDPQKVNLSLLSEEQNGLQDQTS